MTDPYDAWITTEPGPDETWCSLHECAYFAGRTCEWCREEEADRRYDERKERT